MNIVIFRHHLWEVSNNGSIACLTNFLNDYHVTDVPWILVVLKKLEFDLGNRYQCNEKCLKTLKNQVITFYVYDFNDYSNVVELEIHLKKFDVMLNFYSVDLIGGNFCYKLREQFKKNKRECGTWTHLSTLHNTKNIKALAEYSNIFVGNSSVTVHTKFGEISLDREDYSKEKKFVENADLYVTVSESEREWVRDVLGRNTKPIVLYYPTMLWWEYTYSDIPDMFYIRKRYSDSKIFLFMGRITYQKGVDKLLDVRWPSNAHLCIMSGLDFCDQGLLQRVKNFCEQNQESATWIGSYYNSQKFDVMRQCDCVIVPSVYEPFGLVGLETMLFTDSVLMTSNIDGIKDYTVEGGYINCGTSVCTIQEAIDTLMHMSNEQKHSIVEKGKIRAKKFIESQRN